MEKVANTLKPMRELVSEKMLCVVCGSPTVRCAKCGEYSPAVSYFCTCGQELPDLYKLCESRGFAPKERPESLRWENSRYTSSNRRVTALLAKLTKWLSSISK